MWTLAQIQTRLSDRLGETSTVFWGESDRTNYINDAQKFIASVTRGVEQTVTGTVSRTTPYLTLPAKVVNGHPSEGYITDGDALTIANVSIANKVFPGWRTFQGRTPKWLIVDLTAKKAYVSPIPVSESVNLSVAVLPADLVNPTDELFDGVDIMEKYQGATLQMAAVYALLKERYDQEAEKYYQFAMQELQTLGISPNDIPPFQEVRTNGQLDSQ